MRAARLILAGTLLTAGCVTFVYRQGVSPRLTLYKLSRAIDGHDLATFRQYADVDALAEQLDAIMPRTFPELEQRMVAVNIPKGIFTPAFREQIEHYVEHDDAPPRTRDLLDMLRGADAETAIRAVAEQPDGTTLVTLHHDFTRANFSTDVGLVMEKRGAFWVLTRIENLASIMSALDQFEISRLRTRNREIKTELARTLTIRDARALAEPPPRVRFTAKNIGGETIERVRLRMNATVGPERVAYADFWMTLHLGASEERTFDAPPEALQHYSRQQPMSSWAIVLEPIGMSTSTGRVLDVQSGPAGIPE